MQIRTTARHFELTPGIKDHVEERLGRLSKYSRPILKAHAVLSVEKHRHTAEITLSGKGFRLVGSGVADDMFAAIDQGVARLESQVKRQKDKVVTRKTRKTRNAQLKVLDSGSVGRGDEEHDVIESTAVPIRQMTVDEAILELETSKVTFLVFENGGTDRVSVVYRRADGHFAVIEPA